MLAKRVEHNNKIYFQSFKGHIEDGLRILISYFEIKQNIISSFCKKWEIDIEKFYQNLFLTVALHDIGKLTVQFQKNIKVGKRSHRYPHPLFGIPILLEIPFALYEKFPLSTLAILGHHSQLHKSIYDSPKVTIASNVDYLNKEILEFVNKQTRIFYEVLEFNKYFQLPVYEYNSFNKMSRDDIVDEFIYKYKTKNIFQPTKTKAIFTYILSVLQLCDDYSSANFSQFIKENNLPTGTFDSIIKDTSQFVYDVELKEEKIKEKLFQKFTPHKFQQELYDKSNKFSFLYAPCGRGKTEAALWWAFKLKKTMQKDKIIFALPTQVTCNAMYDRLIDKYKLNEKNVGIFHGKSFIALKYRREVIISDEFESSEDNDFKSYDILKDEVFKGNIFFKPITVTTIDHLAYSFVHGFSQADFACGNLQNAIIIFDEVHYYEKQTLDILLRLFQILKKMDIPHLLMTGTAPDFLLKEVKKNNYSVFTDKEGLSYKPFIIFKKGSFLTNQNNTIKSIIDDYKQSKNVFIILNQVEWAQNFCKKLNTQLRKISNKPNIILYHSRFIHKHRVKKENEIREKVKQKPCILVTTQVIEISLDISCDVMYTTIAPPDAIGQRGGRINRSGKHYGNGFTYEVKLFSIENHRPYPEDVIQNSWKCFNDGAYSYKDIKKVCDEVYKNYELVKDYLYNDYFKQNILFGHHHKDITYGDDEGKGLKIRSDDFQQINVVPSRVYEEAEKLVTQKKAIWAEFEVKIPFYRIKNDIHEHGELYNFHKRYDDKVIECDFEYDYELGIQFENYYKPIKIV